MKASSSFTDLVSCADNLSSVSMSELVSLSISCASPCRRSAFGRSNAAADSSCKAVNRLMDWSRAETAAWRSGKSTAFNATVADFNADISASRASRRSGASEPNCLSACRSRNDEARSTRRLCSAVNMYSETSATAAIRLMAPSRVQELQALNARTIMMAAAMVTITDFKIALTDIRSSITFPLADKPWLDLQRPGEFSGAYAIGGMACTLGLLPVGVAGIVGGERRPHASDPPGNCNIVVRWQAKRIGACSKTGLLADLCGRLSPRCGRGMLAFGSVLMIADRQGQKVGKIDQRDHGAVDGHQPGQEVDARGLRDPRHRLDLRGVDGDDVQDPVGKQADLSDPDLDDDHDVQRRGVGQPLPEPTAQIDDRHHDAAQIEHAAHVFRLLREMGDLGPALDLAHRHDVDAVLVLADGEADELGEADRAASAVGRSPIDRLQSTGIDGRRCGLLAHAPLPPPPPAPQGPPLGVGSVPNSSETEADAERVRDRRHGRLEFRKEKKYKRLITKQFMARSGDRQRDNVGYSMDWEMRWGRAFAQGRPIVAPALRAAAQKSDIDNFAATVCMAASVRASAVRGRFLDTICGRTTIMPVIIAPRGGTITLPGAGRPRSAGAARARNICRSSPSDGAGVGSTPGGRATPGARSA